MAWVRGERERERDSECESEGAREREREREREGEPHLSRKAKQSKRGRGGGREGGTQSDPIFTVNPGPESYNHTSLDSAAVKAKGRHCLLLWNSELLCVCLDPGLTVRP